ncbi:MBL fold metallo-hydrolase [Amycolatopsis acidiphila]|uniref:MBL fold metallo-hydrolase n=1 Tax=Amycolatopsis acidiphila TaxID=715473 RepID=A0A557ZRA6_9PSEU|nr:MBL fold metallo-hydrolase [Amycolatopsis acidiphila]TVT14553.1 MBL fold metallo-hydrolase [Amycolatopsis acidiphila]UIJ59499.1 MBL fold metallo-hydrolase [Amycolatopsis acidiphila]GHG80245.1 MBL fold metallo-hydrolase [Amycolatopsis acidiphila]
MTHPAYGEFRQVSPVASVLLENNPSSMTLEGTNSWVLRAPGADECVIVDPGYHDLDHLPKLAEAGRVALILLTHHHADHSEGGPWLAERVGAPVRAFDPALCGGVESFVDGETISAAGLELEVLHTPGHTEDSVCFRFGDHVLTGDTILGRGTTVLADLGAYLRSLRRLLELPAGLSGLPGHGPELAELKTTAQEYLDHREQRLDQVRAALEVLGENATPRQIVEHVYADVDQALWAPAEHSVRAQLEYLRG